MKKTILSILLVSLSAGAIASEPVTINFTYHTNAVTPITPIKMIVQGRFNTGENYANTFLSKNGESGPTQIQIAPENGDFDSFTLSSIQMLTQDNPDVLMTNQSPCGQNNCPDNKDGPFIIPGGIYQELCNTGSGRVDSNYKSGDSRAYTLDYQQYKMQSGSKIGAWITC